MTTAADSSQLNIPPEVVRKMRIAASGTHANR
jgi:hypothetical protein